MICADGLAEVAEVAAVAALAAVVALVPVEATVDFVLDALVDCDALDMHPVRATSAATLDAPTT